MEASHVPRSVPVMNWNWDARVEADERGHVLRSREAGIHDLLKLIDDMESSKLAASRTFEDHLLDGVVVDEGEAPLATVIQRAVMLARSLDRGRILGVHYAGEREARIEVSPGGGRVAVAILDGRVSSGHVALQLYGRVRGEYQLVVVES